MEQYPKSLQKFESQFSTEDACLKYLFDLRWPNGFTCPKCHSTRSWTTNRHTYYCAACNHQTSVTAGTIFHGSRKPLRLWFSVIWYITSEKYGTNAMTIRRALQLGSYKTAWAYLNKLRQVMVRPGREKLSGTVEVDETYLGGKKAGKRGRGAQGKSLVAIAVEDAENGMGRIRLQRINDASGDSLKAFIKANIAERSTIRTDSWQGYNGIEQDGYSHIVIKESADVGENMLQLVHIVAGLLKRWILGTYQGSIKPAFLDYYLDEFTFRFNRRKSHFRGKLFYRLLQQAILYTPLEKKLCAHR
ncbi:MAG: IS1595 family transposase [Nitrospiraceae bacterium]|nr:IS1595 family transposase [Nitrospiraceae bacterium]